MKGGVYRMLTNNPFKFSTIVDGEYFTDRVAE